VADYQGTANSIYDPQQQSEAVALDRQRANAELGLGEEEKTIDPYYNDAIKSVSKARDEEGYKTDLNYSTALSGMGSGLQGNEQRQLGEKKIEQTSRLESERVDKKGNIAARRKAVGDDYTAGMSGLAAKYAGLKSAYVVDAQNRDADVARAERQAAQDRQFQLQRDSASRAFDEKMTKLKMAADAPDYHANAKADALAALDAARAKGVGGDAFYRDKVYQRLASQYKGQIGESDLKNLVYGDVFANGWDKKYGIKFK
jgi:hypothetical protein